MCNSNAMDPDSNVNNLNKSLSSFEEIATACMGHYKFRCYFRLASFTLLFLSCTIRINPDFNTLNVSQKLNDHQIWESLLTSMFLFCLIGIHLCV